MSQEKSFKDMSTGFQALYIIVSVGMIAVSAYLTQHYFDVLYPTGLTSTSLCDINSFFTCDAATHSHISNIMGVPISLFGLLFGIFLLVGFMFKNELIEGTNHALSMFNLAGCLALFFYSIFALGSLCPFCTLYYVLSGIMAFIFFKASANKRPSVKVLAAYGVVTALAAGLTYATVKDKEKKQDQLSVALIQAYDSLSKLGNPETPSPYRIASSTEKFEDAPLQITIFSDFQCPACKALSEQMHPLEKRYKGKINIQYMFYPLDHHCNDKMTRPLHPMACQAAYLAACKPAEFAEIHDEIFAHQSELSADWLKNYAKEKGVTECMNDPATKQKVVDILKRAEPFNVRSTPTMLINGVKVEGVRPVTQLYAILDELLKRHEQKN